MDFGSLCQCILPEPFLPLSSTFLQICPHNCTFHLLISLSPRAETLRVSLTGAGHSPGEGRRPASNRLVTRLHPPSGCSFNYLLNAGHRSTILTNTKQSFTLLDLKLCTRFPASHPQNENNNICLSPVLPLPCGRPGPGAGRARGTPGAPWLLRHSWLRRRVAAVGPTLPVTTPPSSLPGSLHHPLFPSPVI